MSTPDVPVSVYLAYYDHPDAARQDYDELRGLVSAGTIEMDAMLLASRHADGKIDVTDDFHTDWKGTGRGAAVAPVVGAMFPPSPLGGAAAGGRVGDRVGRLATHADKGGITADLEDGMPPHGSAIVAVFDEVWVDRVRRALSGSVKSDERQLDEAGKDAIKATSV